MKIILPKNLPEIDLNYGPLFFLAGPVNGGGNWQKRCCELLKNVIPNCYVAIPYYHDNPDKLTLNDEEIKGREDVFERQLDWERYFLEFAAKNGCLIFWLPEEDKNNPRPQERGPYATDTRGEIARWSVELKYNPTHRIVIGAEPNFHSLSQIQRNFSKDQGHECIFPETLEETVQEAVKKAVN